MEYITFAPNHLNNESKNMKIGVTNLKGGVGKTTISQNLAACLAGLNYSVAIIDTDKNQNSIAWAEVRGRNEDLPKIEVFGITDEKKLERGIQKLEKEFDVIVIDGTPSLSEMTTRVVLVSDFILIPILPAAQDIRAVQYFLERIEEARKFKPDIYAAFLLNQYQGFNAQKEVAKVLDTLEVPVLTSTIKPRVAYNEVAIEGRGVTEWTDWKAAAEFAELAKEILTNLQSLNLI